MISANSSMLTFPEFYYRFRSLNIFNPYTYGLLMSTLKAAPFYFFKRIQVRPSYLQHEHIIVIITWSFSINTLTLCCSFLISNLWIHIVFIFLINVRSWGYNYYCYQYWEGGGGLKMISNLEKQLILIRLSSAKLRPALAIDYTGTE